MFRFADALIFTWIFMDELIYSNFNETRRRKKWFTKNFSMQNGLHATHIILVYTHLDIPIVADLFLNQRLLTAKHFLRSQNADGTENIQTFNRSNSNLCHYQVNTQFFAYINKGLNCVKMHMLLMIFLIAYRVDYGTIQNQRLYCLHVMASKEWFTMAKIRIRFIQMKLVPYTDHIIYSGKQSFKQTLQNFRISLSRSSLHNNYFNFLSAKIKSMSHIHLYWIASTLN